MSFKALCFAFVTAGSVTLAAVHSNAVWAQGSARFDLAGRVLDRETGEPLPGVNVFLANTMLGSATNNDGEFLIRSVPAGTYDLVASMIGYEMQKRKVVVTGPVAQPFVFRLRQKPLQAPEIEVTAEPNKQWQKDYKRFLTLFFSTTRNARQCAILNAPVLDFTRTEGGFQATASEPLVIENRALGYRIRYVLEHFLATEDLVQISRIAQYEELQPSSEAERLEWERNRVRAYRGSLRHFLRTVYRQAVRSRGVEAEENGRVNLLEQEGFRVFHVKQPGPWEPYTKRKPTNTNRFVRPGTVPTEWVFTFPNYLEVIYLKEREEDEFLAYYYEFRKPREQRSFITVDNRAVAVDTTGRVYTRFGIKTYGYWGWVREADELPGDYVPPPALGHGGPQKWNK